MLRAISIACAVLSWPALAMAQEPDAVSPPRYGMRASYDHAPQGALVIAFARSDPARWITEFWVVSSGWMREGVDPVVFARRALDSWDGQEQIKWADSRDCPGLVEALLSANELRVPGVIVPLDDQSRSQAREAGYSSPPAPDGVGPHVFWAPGRGPAGLEVQFSAYGGPWVEWSNATASVTESCWQSQRPPYPERG